MGIYYLGVKKFRKVLGDEKIKVIYERFMSTLVNDLFKMLSFFAFVQIRVIKDMVHEDVVIF